VAEAASDSAAGVRATLKEPGVVPPVLTLSQVAEGVIAVDQDVIFVTSVAPT
jgi:hypothetical protein